MTQFFIACIYSCILCTLLNSCLFRKSAAKPALAGDDAYQDRIQEIEAEIDQLLGQLEGSSRGAYNSGPRMITGKPGDETLLDRLYNAENSLGKTRIELENKQISIAKLKQTVLNNTLLVKSLELKAELYEKNRDKILTLQDNRKQTLVEMSNLRSNLIESELKLLSLQSEHFNFARIILELEPGDTQGFLDLQEHIKQMTLELNPTGKEHLPHTAIEEDIQ